MTTGPACQSMGQPSSAGQVAGQGCGGAGEQHPMASLGMRSLGELKWGPGPREGRWEPGNAYGALRALTQGSFSLFRNALATCVR